MYFGYYRRPTLLEEYLGGIFGGVVGYISGMEQASAAYANSLQAQNWGKIKQPYLNDSVTLCEQRHADKLNT